jgi:hypothetical protein
MNLMGAGTLFLALGASGISNLKKNREASAITEAGPLSNNTNSMGNDTNIPGSMIVHFVRFTLKPNAPKNQVDLAFEQLRKQGREIKAVQLFCVGRDFGREFHYGAMYIMHDKKDKIAEISKMIGPSLNSSKTLALMRAAEKQSV